MYIQFAAVAKVSSVNNLARRRRDFFFFGTDLSSDVLIARLAGTGKLKIHTTAAEDKYYMYEKENEKNLSSLEDDKCSTRRTESSAICV